MNIKYQKDSRNRKTAAIIPIEDWEKYESYIEACTKIEKLIEEKMASTKQSPMGMFLPPSSAIVELLLETISKDESFSSSLDQMISGLGMPGMPSSGIAAAPLDSASLEDMDSTPYLLQLRIDLNGAKPPIWRRVIISSQSTLADLHATIQAAMGWYNAHLHHFETDAFGFISDSVDPDFGLSSDHTTDQIPLYAVLESEGDKIGYTYDFGDDWEHTIKLEKKLPYLATPAHPTCLKGKGACPPEDCGGMWGYYDLLEALKNKRHEMHKEYVEFYGKEVLTEQFDLQHTDRKLKNLQMSEW